VTNDTDERYRKTDLHITIDEYQREFLENGDGGDVNVSRLVRATLDAVIPPAEQPDAPPDRGGWDVDVAYNGPVSDLPRATAVQRTAADE
jgi:hypothetical protein